MRNRQCEVTTTAELVAAVSDGGTGHITILTDMNDVPMLRLAPGQTLTGKDPQTRVSFAPGQEGLQLSIDNQVEHLSLMTQNNKRVLLNDTTVASFGRLELRNLHVTGRVQLLACDRVRSGHVEVQDLDIEAADARGDDPRPKGYGVEVLPGAFTLWNQQNDPSVTITANLVGLAAGRAGAPVRGSGIFISGAGDAGGKLIVRNLETKAVYSNGGIKPGTPDRISGGVFTVHGAFVDCVHNRGAVTTYGPNDMVLDNWGQVDHWVAEEKVTTYGPSAIGFVNFGTVNLLEVKAPIETFGQGARGYNVYAGTVCSAEFERVVTHADGAVGIQISQPTGNLTVRRGIETYGGVGASLVEGVVVTLSAIALSVKRGGSLHKVRISGGLITHGQGVTPLELHGTIGALEVTGNFAAIGGGFDGN